MIGPLKYLNGNPLKKCYYSARKFEDGNMIDINCEDHVELYWNKDRDSDITKYNPIVQILVICKDNSGHCTIIGRYYRYIL